MRPLIGTVLLLAMCVGCSKPEAQLVGKPEAQLVGKWRPDPTSMTTGDPKQDAMLTQMSPFMAIEFKADKTFVMAGSISGTYEISSHTVTMKPSSVMGVDPKAVTDPTKAAAFGRPMTLTLSEDGKTLMMGPNKPVKFTKEN